jgi:hypothetical protein
MAPLHISYRVVSVLAMVLASSAIVRAQKPNPSPKLPFVRVRWSDTTLHITYQGKKIDHDFRESAPGPDVPEYKRFEPSTIATVKTQRLFEKEGQVFMLLDVRGPSRGPEAAMSYCGAGEEKALVLFHSDSDGLLEEPQVVNYESCLYTIGDPDDSSEDATPASPGAKQPFVKVLSFTRMRGPADPKDFAVNRDLVTVEARFDPNHPEQGLATQEKVEDYKAAIHSP